MAKNLIRSCPKCNSELQVVLPNRTHSAIGVPLVTNSANPHTQKNHALS
jgi:hypothetical protein